MRSLLEFAGPSGLFLPQYAEVKCNKVRAGGPSPLASIASVAVTSTRDAPIFIQLRLAIKMKVVSSVCDRILLEHPA